VSEVLSQKLVVWKRMSREILLLLLLLLLLLNANGFIPCDCMLQSKRGQYSTAQYKAIKYNDTSHIIKQHSR
jgi:hypothetical protein